MNNNIPSKIVCDISKSGLFYNYEAKEHPTIPTEDEFSIAIKDWKYTKSIKSLRKYAAAGNDLSTFYKDEHIGKYLSRREIAVDQWGIPIVHKYEASLYAGLSEFSTSTSFSFEKYGQQMISYRCNFHLNCPEEDDLAKAKNVTQLHAIDRFLISGTHKSTAKSLLKLNSTLFNTAKINNQSLYKGVHYLPVSGLAYSNESENRILSERNRLINDKTLNENNIPYFDIQKFIEELELEKIVKFDDCNFNVCLHHFGALEHGIVLLYIIDTKTPGKAKVTKIIGFNSWSKECPDDPLASLENNINKFRQPSDPLKIVKIYYGAQIGGKGLLNRDNNCNTYALHTMNGLAKLLTCENTLYHKRFIQGLEPSFIKKMIANMILYVLYFFSLFIINLCIKQLSFSTMSVVSLLLTTVTAYYCMSNLINSPLKTELQRALPEYFDEKNGLMIVKDFEKRKIVHIQDRWLIGNIIIEKLIKKSSKFQVWLGGKSYKF